MQNAQERLSSKYLSCNSVMGIMQFSLKPPPHKILQNALVATTSDVFLTEIERKKLSRNIG